MKKILMLSLAILMVASYATADTIGVYADLAGTDCDFVASTIGPVTVYVVQNSPVGTTGSQFKLVNTSSWTFSAAVANAAFLSIGDAFTDLSLAYTACVVGTFPVLNLNGFSFPFPGTPCGAIEVVSAPNKVGIIAVDCNFAEIPATGGRIVFDPNTSCPCQLPTATEQSTWGKVKSLYR